MKVVFERHFNRVADMLNSRVVVSRGRAPSPSRLDRDPDRSKRTRVAQSLEDGVDDDGDEDVEEEEEEEEPTSVSRAVERERFSRITKKDMKKSTDVRGKFDVLRRSSLFTRPARCASDHAMVDLAYHPTIDLARRCKCHGTITYVYAVIMGVC